ncbi:amidohydrolase family protein [Occultella gossypii]|uniref:Amidohydrolase family protein n=1 Tax=Occultella gossypii TaxID=2800820 RepID=A0ABS7S6L2_9MICO|nr:amidohydrolase family protein [Occultella gossypii]MBZ2195993.1 amidohydrolase family protein [Occultella gossypii]
MTSSGDVIALSGTIVADGEREYGRAWVRDGRLTLGEPGSSPTAEVTISGWVLPGLVDMHCHLGLGPDGAVDEASTLAQAAADLAAGTLLVRDAGSPIDSRWLQHAPARTPSRASGSAAQPPASAEGSRPRVDAPELIRAGHHLARPKRYLRHYATELDDVADLPAAMAEQARFGDGWVKIVGDWIDRARGADSDLEPLWPADVVTAGIAAAHDAGARVTVHTFATETIDPLLDAGVDCLEHGTGLTPVQIERAAAAGVAVVPTMLQIDRFEAIAAQGEAKYPRYAARMRAMYARRYAQVRDLHDAGVRLFLGTDAGGTIGHGRIADEAAELVRAGLPVAAVVAAASWLARDYLGRPGIADGAPADVVVYPADPREDIAVLAHPSAVIRAGHLLRR